LQIPKWKWETISTNFITGLPKTIKKDDVIMFILDKLSKASYFIPIKSTLKSINVANGFMKDIFRLHGFPNTIILDRDAKFTSSLWKILFVGLGTKLEFSMAYHPQTYGQIERVNIVLEDMLRMHVIH
jgi:hypothetical protein